MKPPYPTAAELSRQMQRQLMREIPGRASKRPVPVIEEAAAEKVHWCRVVMNRAVRDFVDGLPRHRMDVLEVSGNSWGDPAFGFRSYRSLSYPQYDLCQAPFAREFCDLLILEQVLEHVRRPHQALVNARAMLRPGGRILVNTPFLLKYHPCPVDLYRWTEEGLRALLEDSGFTTVRTGSWGNRQCLAADMQPGMAWTYYDPAAHSLENESQFPIVVWAFAQKPDAR